MKTPPTFPKVNTLTARAPLSLLDGRCIVHNAFQSETGSYRLAVFIESLRNRHKWPIETEEITAPAGDSKTGRIASYAQYYFEPANLSELKIQFGERLNGFIVSVRQFEGKR
ncbi:hypothetical protein [Methylomonas koyamae]|uniref:hypothetical protein n=1 Tax=Methylomonas koyamae TaxID=702114 RepID=UPI001128A78D|nr:hypothetical protein [Methylomonas koyamae]TPQ27633.1 hypothetical protein C2U68_07955 [Methylomonas koyamae]